MPWEDFLDSIDGHWKKTTWRDRKREDAIRIVFVVIGNFVHLYHNDALLCYCKFKELDLSGHVTLRKGERSHVATMAAKYL